jgi:NitT/TauT family transport system substrate-binding protein/putative hydroxymethylpyrimidine transport system substrate-binding protein
MGQGRPLLAAIAVALLAGCGGGGGGKSDSGPQPATLLLDFTPNAVHAGIFTAVAQGFDRELGVRLRVREPGSSADAVKLLAAGKTDFAVLDIHDLGLAREKGADLVGIFPLVQRPLAAVIAQPGVRSPRALEGRRVGVTGVPSDEAVLRSIVAGAGGDATKVRTTTIGFNAVQALLARRVDGATAFWNAEGVALKRRRPGFHVFRVDDYGAPAYPELVVAVTGRTLRQRRLLVDHVRGALRRGYGVAEANPSRAVADLVQASPGLDRSLTAAQMAAVAPAFGQQPGRLDVATLRAWGKWDVRFGILRRAPNVHVAFLPTG